MTRIAAQKILARPLAYRSTVMLPKALPFTQVRCDSSLPTVADASFWSSLVPKPFRKENRASFRKGKKKSKEWNPATFFIVIFLLIGSMSINTIAVRTAHANFVRQADTKIGVLRDIVDRLQKGEKVDVAKELGSGNSAEEKAWGDCEKTPTIMPTLSCACCRCANELMIVLRDIETKDTLQEAPKQKKSRKAKSTETAQVDAPAIQTQPDSSSSPSPTPTQTSTRPSQGSRSSFY